MDQNFDDIYNTYGDLAAGEGSSWEIYSGEEFRVKAEEKGIPESKWFNDHLEMAFGQEAVAEELSKGIPQSPEERESRLRAFIARQIDCRLNSESDDITRKGMLLQAIQSGRSLNASELAAWSRKDLNELREEVLNLTVAYTIEKVLPEIDRQCRSLSLDPEQKEQVMKNPAALAAACYLEMPELREMASILGAEAEAIERYATNTESDLQENVAKALEYIAYGLLLVSALIASWALFMAVTPTMGAFVIRAFFEGEAIAEVGALIVSAIPHIVAFLVPILKWSAVGAALGAVTGLLSHILSTRTEEQTPAIETNPYDYTVPVNT